MMAQDSTVPPRARLSAETLGLVQAALHTFVLTPESADGELKGALERLGLEARAAGVPPEEVLVTLKHLWSELPGVNGQPASDHARALQRAVTMCIKEYYR